jgi:hypothetical protein
MGYVLTGCVELPVPAELTLGALQRAVESHSLVDARKSRGDTVDVIGRLQDERGEEKIRFTVRDSAGGTSELEHGSWGLRGVHSAERYQAVLDGVLEKTRDAVARSLAEQAASSVGAYVGTLVGAQGLDIEIGRSVAVVLGNASLSLRYGDATLELGRGELAEVGAVPTSTAGLPVDHDALERAVTHASTGTLLSIATMPETGVHVVVHVGGSTTSVVNAELAHFRISLHPSRPAGLPIIRRPQPGSKLSRGELVRQMTALAALHHAGDLSEREWIAAKNQLLGL